MISEKPRTQSLPETGLNHPRFHSVSEFLRELMETLKLAWKMRRDLKKTDRRLRETISLTVTFANNCAV